MVMSVSVENVRSRVISLKKGTLGVTDPEWESDWEQVFDHAAVDECIAGVAIFDKNLVLRKCNKIYSDKMGQYTPYTDRPSSGVHYADILSTPAPSLPFDPWFGRVMNSARGEAHYNVQLNTVQRGHRIVSNWHSHLSPLVGHGGSVVGLAMICLDITGDAPPRQTLDDGARTGPRDYSLDDMKTVLRSVIDLIDARRPDLAEPEDRVLKHHLLPLIGLLKNTALSAEQKAYVHAMECCVAGIGRDRPAPSTDTASAGALVLTPAESRVARYVKAGRSSKEIANILGVTKESIDFHRHNIRKKLGLSNKKVSLNQYLHVILGQTAP